MRELNPETRALQEPWRLETDPQADENCCPRGTAARQRKLSDDDAARPAKVREAEVRAIANATPTVQLVTGQTFQHRCGLLTPIVGRDAPARLAAEHGRRARRCPAEDDRLGAAHEWRGTRASSLLGGSQSIRLEPAADAYARGDMVVCEHDRVLADVSKVNHEFPITNPWFPIPPSVDGSGLGRHQ